MLASASLLLLLAAPPPAAGDAVRSVPVAVYTKKLEAIDDLDATEVSLKEDGATRKVLEIERDRRPMDVALILDSSRVMGPNYRSVLVDAALGFWTALPEEASLSIWTNGGRPSRIVDFGTSVEDARPALELVAPAGESFTLDAIIDASLELQKRAAPRRVLVVVTDSGYPVTKTLAGRASGAMARARVTPMVIYVQTTLASGEGFDTESLIENLAKGYGGTMDKVLTPMAASGRLEERAADLSSQYQVRYSSAAEPSVPEVKVKRKDTRVRPGMSVRAH